MAPSSQDQAIWADQKLESFQAHTLSRPVSAADPFWRRFIAAELGRDGVERLQVIYVDGRDGYMHDHIAATGCAKKVSASAEAIMDHAHQIGAIGFYLAHNHPSGSARPSQTDIDSTARLIELALSHGLLLRDHIIIAGKRFFSLRKGSLI